MKQYFSCVQKVIYICATLYLSKLLSVYINYCIMCIYNMLRKINNPLNKYLNHVGETEIKCYRCLGKNVFPMAKSGIKNTTQEFYFRISVRIQIRWKKVVKVKKKGVISNLHFEVHSKVNSDNGMSLLLKLFPLC